MIKALFKRELTSGYKLLLIFMGVLSLYVSMIIAMFDPKLGDSLSMMAKSMPEIFAAFGMMNIGNTLLQFISNYLYGFLLIAFPIVYIILLSSRLMAKYIDRGSMAYLLASPHKRVSIGITQAAAMLSFLCMLVVYITALGAILSAIMFEGQLDIKSFMIINICWFGLLVFMGGLCFCSTCLFSDTKYSLGIGGGLCIVFILIQMISQVGDKFGFLKFFTPLSLFNVIDIADGNTNAAFVCSILYIGGFALFAVGIYAFSKRDLNI